MACTNCACFRGDTSNERTRAITSAALLYPPSVSVPVWTSIVKAGFADNEAKQSDDQQIDAGNTPQTNNGRKRPRTIVRIWGRRTFQHDEDNDPYAKRHWKRCIESVLADVQKHGSVYSPEATSEVYESTTSTSVFDMSDRIHALSPGAGPGLPDHYPVSLDCLAAEQVVKVCCSANFMLFLTQSGSVYAYGQNLNGELGLGPLISFVREAVLVKFRMPVTDDFDASRVAHPPLRSPAITLTDSPDFQTISEVKSVEDEAVRIIDIACGDSHAIALTSTGLVFTWGKADAVGHGGVENVWYPTLLDRGNFKSPIGQKQPTMQIKGQKMFPPEVPTHVGQDYNEVENLRVARIAASGECSIFVTMGNELYSCGYCPTGMHSNYPEYIGRFSPQIKIRKIGMGEDVVVILTTSGELFQWGASSRGELLPRRGKSVYGGGRRISSAQIKIDRNVFMPRVVVDPGFDTEMDPQYMHNAHLSPTSAFPEFLGEIRDAAGNLIGRIADIAVGSRHVLLLTEDGNVYAYGDNSSYQCGIGSDSPSLVEHGPVRVRVGLEGTSLKVACVAAGKAHSGLITNAGLVFLWGQAGNFKLISTAAKEEAVINVSTRATAAAASGGRQFDPKPFFASMISTNSLGVSISANCGDAYSRPFPAYSLFGIRTAMIGLGPEYSVVISGSPPRLNVEFDPIIAVRPMEPVVAAAKLPTLVKRPLSEQPIDEGTSIEETEPEGRGASRSPSPAHRLCEALSPLNPASNSPARIVNRFAFPRPGEIKDFSKAQPSPRCADEATPIPTAYAGPDNAEEQSLVSNEESSLLLQSVSSNTIKHDQLSASTSKNRQSGVSVTSSRHYQSSSSSMKSAKTSASVQTSGQPIDETSVPLIQTSERSLVLESNGTASTSESFVKSLGLQNTVRVGNESDRSARFGASLSEIHSTHSTGTTTSTANSNISEATSTTSKSASTRGTTTSKSSSTSVAASLVLETDRDPTSNTAAIISSLTKTSR